VALGRSPNAPIAPPPRQQDYTAAQVIEAITQARGLVTAAARLLGCDPSTVDRYVNRYPTVAAAKRQAREGILDMAEAGLIQSIRDREPWAIKYYLSTQGKDRGYTEKHEMDHRGSIEHVVIEIGENE